MNRRHELGENFVNSKLLAAALAFAIGASIAVPAQAQTYPDHAVRLIVSFPAGGSVDTLGRIVAQKLGDRWNQSAFVENRAGAGGNIGSGVAAAAAPDGYTLDFACQCVAANVTIAPMRDFDPRTNLDPIVLIATGQDVLMVPPDSPFHSVKELVDHAKAHPGELNVASLGVGSSSDLATALFSEVTGITLQKVPYNSYGQAMTDLSAGRTSMWLATLGGALGQVQSGKVRALAVSGSTRSAQLPDVATFDELGVPYGNDTSWYALFAPAGTPRDIVAKINADTNLILADADMKARAAALGYRLVGGTPEQLGAFLRADIDKWANVAKKGGLAIQ
jgi:tripartite-type tricarboxylate transporter receptor subunit TctC